MDCRDSALFSGVDEASCENMLRCFSAYEQRFTSGQTILTCGQQQDMIGVLLSGSAALLRLHPDGNSTVLESLEEGSVFGEELAFTGFRDGSALIECREDCRVVFMRYDQITKRCENACACHSQVVTNLFQLLSKKSRKSCCAFSSSSPTSMAAGRSPCRFPSARLLITSAQTAAP